MKIILGTANFFKNYGALKKKIKNRDEIKNILNFLKKKNIRYIDTANSYIIKKYLDLFPKFKNFKITTKIMLPQKNQELFVNNLEKKLTQDLLIFNQTKFESILLHNVYDLKSNIGKKFLKNLISFKKNGFTKYLGVSIYELKDFNFVIKKFKPDIVQFPLNVFDQRFLDKKFLIKLKKNQIKSQVRSVFLQGIILYNKKKKFFVKKNKLKNNLAKFDDWCIKNKLSKNEACLLFIKKQKNLNFVILGVDNLDQIKQNLAILKKDIKLNFRKFAINNYKLIDPRKW